MALSLLRPRGGGNIEQFGKLFMPEEAMQPILARGVRSALMEWLTEIWAEADLLEIGVTPRKRAMFTGKPGTGKTTLAHHLSARLGLPMLAVRPECIISKWAGETGENIGRLFNLAEEGLANDDGSASTPIVLFIDEFDALSRQRRRSEQAADDGRNEEVNTLLQRIEQFPGFLITATNFGEHIDQAIWRRFDIHIELDLPGQDERERILERYLSPFKLPPRALKLLGEAFSTAAPALMRQFCENLKRQTVIGPRLGLDMSKVPTIERLLMSVHPHPDLSKPRLWSLGGKDEAVSAMPWPLPREGDVIADLDREGAASSCAAEIVPFKRGAP